MRSKTSALYCKVQRNVQLGSDTHTVLY